ncbi:MAG: MBL fold metallo-hydrolase [Candidatus Heimdallarchaeota archaeon]
MTYEEISKSVVLAQNEFGSNSICISLENELIFVDAGMSTTIASEFRKNMEAKFGKKASTLILTHGHIDHFFGMGAFADLKVIAPTASKEKIERYVKAEFTKEIVASFEIYFPTFTEAAQVAKLFMPSVWFEDKMSLGKNEEILIQITGGHTDCSSSVYFKPEKVMIAGDLLQVEVSPYFGEPDNDMNKWIQTLKSWEKMSLDAYLPGHGPKINVEYLVKVREFFEQLLETVTKLKEKGLTVEQVLEHSSMPTGYWPKDATKPAYQMSIVNLYKYL